MHRLIEVFPGQAAVMAPALTGKPYVTRLAEVQGVIRDARWQRLQTVSTER